MKTSAKKPYYLAKILGSDTKTLAYLARLSLTQRAVQYVLDKCEFDKMRISRNLDRQNTELAAKTSKLRITSAILAENPCKK
mgnify:CR=1 FL=1